MSPGKGGKITPSWEPLIWWVLWMTKVTLPVLAPSWGWVWSTVTAFHMVSSETDSEGILPREGPRYLESSSGITGRSLSSPNIISWKVADSFSCTSSGMFVINLAWFITGLSCSQSRCISHPRRNRNGKKKCSAICLVVLLVKVGRKSGGGTRFWSQALEILSHVCDAAEIPPSSFLLDVPRMSLLRYQCTLLLSVNHQIYFIWLPDS